MNEAWGIWYHPDRLPCDIYQFSFKMCDLFFLIDASCRKQPLLKDLRVNSDSFFLLLGFITVVYLSDESCNLVAVKIWADLRHFAIEDIIVRCSIISASNLQWQSEFRSEIPVLLAGDLTAFSASPKENYLQEKINELRSTIEVNL